jgi:hypothetical protein
MEGNRFAVSRPRLQVKHNALKKGRLIKFGLLYRKLTYRRFIMQRDTSSSVYFL